MNSNSDVIEIEYRELIVKDNEKQQKNITSPNMTSYEYAKLLGVRANRIQMFGKSIIKVEWEGPFDPIGIAKKEIVERKIPCKIRRKIPDNTKPLRYREEEWDVNDMNICDC